MPTEPENPPRKPDPTTASDDRRADAPNAQHVEELRAELNGAMHKRERKAIGEELTRARDYLATAGLLAELEERKSQIEARDPQLATRIDRVAVAFLENPNERLRDPKFKTDLSYALQDAEKLVGPFHVDKDLRDDLAKLATSSPGLKNEQMRSLLQMTATLDDPHLVARLREKATEIAAKSNQTTKAIQGEIFALSFEVLQAPRREISAQPITSPSIESEPTIAHSPVSSGASAGAPPTAPDAAAEARVSAAIQAEIDAFDAPTAGRPSARRGAPVDAAERPPEPEGSPTPAAAADEIQRNGFAAAPLSAPNEASQVESVDQTTNPPSAPADKARSEIAAFDASSASTARPPAASESVRDAANAQPKSPPASVPQRSSPAAGDASTPANDDRKLAAFAARPASPAKPTTVPEPPEAVEPDPTTKHEVQFAQEKLVVGGVFGKAIGAVGRSASAIGRILEAATPSAQVALEQSAQQRREQPAREKQANTEDVQRRLQNFEKTRMQFKRDDSLLYAADASGRAALDAMSALRDAPGVTVLNRIQDAAANNKGGMNAVIEGMKPGGAFEGLRKQLDVALDENNAFSAAYDRAAGALARYGSDRDRIVSALSSQPNASNWNEHFKKLDAAVGEAASSIPKKEGDGSMLEHLGEKAREIIEKVLEKIEAVLHRGPEARPSPSPRP